MYNFFCALFIFIVYSIIGYFVELTFVFITERKLSFNRGFLVGPYLPTFGGGALIIVYLLNKYTNDLSALFIMSAFLCCLLEYLISYLMEKAYGLRWWDYSKQKFNLNGRTCLMCFISFGIAGILVNTYINSFILGIINALGKRWVIFLSIIFAVLIIIDYIFSIMVAFDLKSKIKSLGLKDQTDEIKNEVRKKLNEMDIFNKRLMNAFPDVKAKITSLQESIKDKITK